MLISRVGIGRRHRAHLERWRHNNRSVSVQSENCTKLSFSLMLGFVIEAYLKRSCSPESGHVADLPIWALRLQRLGSQCETLSYVATESRDRSLSVTTPRTVTYSWANIEVTKLFGLVGINGTKYCYDVFVWSASASCVRNYICCANVAPSTPPARVDTQ